MGFFFFRAECSNNSQVCGLFVAGELVAVNEVARVGAGYITPTLKQSANFIAVAELPVLSIGAFAELHVICELPGVGIECVAMVGGFKMVNEERRRSAAAPIGVGSVGALSFGAWAMLEWGQRDASALVGACALGLVFLGFRFGVCIDGAVCLCRHPQ